MFLSEYTAGFDVVPSAENLLLSKLLSWNFRGAPELREQLSGMLAKPLDTNGSLRLGVTVPSVAKVDRRIPVEGTYLDNDGTRVHILLHVVDGYLDELEVYREDSGRIARTLATSPTIEIGEAF